METGAMTLAQTILACFTPKILFLIAAGVFGGIIIAAIPGLTATMGIALLVSLTSSWNMVDATALMMGVYAGGVYGGSWSAVLMNIPGAPSAIATGWDGYPLALKGEAGTAIGLATTQSFIGGLLGTLALAVAAPYVADIALGFGSHEYFLLVVMGLTLLGSLSGESMSRGLLGACIGWLCGLVGLDPVYATHRFTFGVDVLVGGIGFLPIVVGIYALAEVFHQMRESVNAVTVTEIGRVVPPISTWIRNLGLTLRCAVIGIVIGFLPGIGGNIAALAAYAHAKNTVRKPSKPFGQGAYEGVIAPETANNASIGGALIPLLTMGIPGDGVTAMLLGAMYIHGMKPGPMVMVNSRDFFWLIVVSCVIANVFMLIEGLLTVNFAARIILVKKEILLPMVVLFGMVGSYVSNCNINDLFVALLFGILGFAMKHLRIPVGPMMLGVILGPMADAELRRALIMSNDSVIGLLRAFVTRPYSLVLLVAVVWILLAQTPVFAVVRGMVARCKSEPAA